MEKAKEIPLPQGNRIYRDQLVTLGDLEEFKEVLLVSIKAIVQANAPHPVKKWLKSYEVKKLLNISTGTLQNLRHNGTFPHTKIGGLIYYDADLINKVLAGQKSDFRPGIKPIVKRK